MSSENYQKTDLGHNIYAEPGARVTTGDFYVTSLSSSDLSGFISYLVKLRNAREEEKARNSIISLESLGSLDSECQELLKVFKFYIGESFNSDIDINRDCFLSLLRSERAGYEVKDFISSCYLLYLSKNDSESACKFYSKSKHCGFYSRLIFFERVASFEEVCSLFSDGLDDFEELEITSLLRCCLREKRFEKAVFLSEFLIDNYPYFNSQVLNLLTKSYKLHKDFEGKHYWLVECELYDRLEKIILEWKELAVNNAGEPRITSCAAILFLISHFQIHELHEYCRDHLDQVTQTVPELRDVIAPSEESETYSVDDFLNKMQSRNEISLVDIFNVVRLVVDGKNVGDVLKSWDDEGVYIKEEDEFLNKLSRILIKSYMLESLEKKVVLNDIDEFVNDNIGRFYEISADLLRLFCYGMYVCAQYRCVIKILKPKIPSRPWPSPLVELYAASLLELEQMKTLEDHLESIERLHENTFLVSVAVNFYSQKKSISDAVGVIELSLNSFPKSIRLWHLYTLLLAGEENKKDLQCLINRLPISLFEHYTEAGFQILHAIATVDMAFSENILCKWFLIDPEAVAIPITNFYLYELIEKKVSISDCAVDGLICGIQYKKDNSEYTKLVGSRGVSGQYVLASDGDIWNLLSGLKDGQTGMLGPYEYKKVEQLSITTTIFRISSEIRDSMNQGDDAFYPMQVSEDNLVEDLIKKLGAFSGTKLIDPIINNKPIPLFMKVAKGGESVENVLQYLCSKESNQHLVVHEGGIKEVDKVLLDLASCVYLAFSGLSYSLISSGIVACLTKETKNLIYNFLEKVNDDDFMSISVGDGKLIRFDKEYVANDFFAKGLSEFVEECNVLEVDLFDVPEWASSHKDVLGVSCYSSIKASISESIPLFILDNTLCQLCAQESISVVDSSCFIMRIQKASRKDFFRDIECFLEVGLPVPLSWERVFRMATQLGEGQKLVSKLIVSNNFIEYEKLTSCLLLAVGSNYSLRRSAFYKYSFYIVNACLENVVMKQDDGTSEDRISSFLFVVFFRLSHTNFPVEFYNQVYLYVSEFIRGHFMNEEYIWKSLEEKLKASL